MEGAVSNALKGSLSDLQLFLRGHELDWKPDSLEVKQLLYALSRGNVEVAELMISSGASVNVQAMPYKRTPLMAACKSITAVKFLIGKGSIVAARDLNGNTALHEAARENSLEISSILLDHGALVDAENEDGKTPLRIAVEIGSHLLAKLFLDCGCSINIKDKDGNTAFSLACYKRQSKIVQSMLDSKRVFDIHQVNKDGVSLIAAACHGGFLSLVQELAKQGSSLTELTKTGESCLHLACKSNIEEMANFLITKGADLEVTDQNGLTPLLAACKAGCFETAKLLIQRGCRVKVLSKRRECALHFVCLYMPRSQNAAKRQSYLRIAKLLIENECEVNVKSEYDSTPFSCLLDDAIALASPIIGRSDTTTIQLAQLLVKCGCAITTQNFIKKSNILHVVALQQLPTDFDEDVLDFLQFFLDHGADPNVPDKDGKLPYELANGKCRDVLRKASAERHLNSLKKEFGVTKPKRIKICLIGKVKAGKTTLMKLLQKSSESSSEKRLPSSPVDDGFEEPRTAGVDFQKSNVHGAGEVLFCDFAGQREFHKIHSLFFSAETTIFLLVVDVTENDLRQTCSYWLSFVKSGIWSGKKIKVAVVGSRRDKLAEKDGKKILQDLISYLDTLYHNWFDISRQAFFYNCRSDVTTELNDYIGDEKQACLEIAAEIPAVVGTVVDDLLPKLIKVLSQSDVGFRDLVAAGIVPELKNKARMMIMTVLFRGKRLSDYDLTEEQVTRVNRHFIPFGLFWALTEKALEKSISESLVKQLLSFLNGIGEIILVRGQVILDPYWFCQSIIGPIFAPESFPVYLERVENGKVNVRDIEKVLERFNREHNQKVISVQEALALLKDLEICYEVENEPELICFPSLLKEERLKDVWKRDDRLIITVDVGIRCKCQERTDIITPGSMPLLQTRGSTSQKFSEPIIWKGGLKVTKVVSGQSSCVVEGLIELSCRDTAIDIIVRGPSQSEGECKRLLEDLRVEVSEVLKERSCGITTDKFYISSGRLKEMDGPMPTYSVEKIERAQRKDPPVAEMVLDGKLYSDLLRDLLIVPDDHYTLLPRDVKLAITRELNRKPELLIPLMTKLEVQKATALVITSHLEKPEADCLLLEWTKRLDATVPNFRKALIGTETLSNLLSLLPEDDTETEATLAGAVAFSEQMCLAEKAVSGCSLGAVASKEKDSKQGSFPSPESSVTTDLLVSCAGVGSAHWETIGVYLGLGSSKLKEIREATPSLVARLQQVIEGWKLNAAEPPTVGRLLTAFDRAGISKRAIEEAFELK
ncbi:death-associated protein kinase 1-like isoform X2 [Oscarella lobularis]|uniref:death-associated protein kinase 1-like isoform X2 n=1 Tax=Oscarella lobularis TaxID=121494 RepID=UPI00331396B4